MVVRVYLLLITLGGGGRKDDGKIHHPPVNCSSRLPMAPWSTWRFTFRLYVGRESLLQSPMFCGAIVYRGWWICMILVTSCIRSCAHYYGAYIVPPILQVRCPWRRNTSGLNQIRVWAVFQIPSYFTLIGDLQRGRIPQVSLVIIMRWSSNRNLKVH